MDEFILLGIIVIHSRQQQLFALPKLLFVGGLKRFCVELQLLEDVFSHGFRLLRICRTQFAKMVETMSHPLFLRFGCRANDTIFFCLAPDGLFLGLILLSISLCIGHDDHSLFHFRESIFSMGLFNASF